MAKRFYQFNKEAGGENLAKRGGRVISGGGNQNSGNSDDELVDLNEVTKGATDFYEKNQKVILGGLVAFALLVGGYFVYKFLYLAPREQKAIEAMAIAEGLFAQDSFAIALETSSGAYEGFLDIIDNYSGTKTANTAKFYAGISYLNLGKFESAEEYLESYSPKDEITPAMRYGALADVKAELKDLESAIDLYSKAASSAGKNDVIAPYYLNKLGLLQYKQGKLDEALTTMNKIISDFPKSMTSADAEKLKARIEAEKM
jgi:tetratricopeptide (TPR) repeat protein